MTKASRTLAQSLIFHLGMGWPGLLSGLGTAPCFLTDSFSQAGGSGFISQPSQQLGLLLGILLWATQLCPEGTNSTQGRNISPVQDGTK